MQKPKVTVSFRTDAKTYASIKARAKLSKQSVSEWIATCVSDLLAQKTEVEHESV